VLGASAERLVARGFLRNAPDGLEVRHSLIAERIVDQLDAEQRRTLHGRLGELITDPSERARHLAAAGRRADAFAVAQAALASVTDPRTRALLLMVAAETSDMATEATQFRLDSSILYGSLGQTDQGLALLEAPIEDDDETRALRAAARAGPLNNDGRYDEAWAVIEAARGLRPAPGSLGLIELTVTEASLLVNRGRLADAIELVEEVRARGGPGASGYRLAGHLAAMRLYAGQFDQLGALEASIAAGLEAGDGAAAAGRAMDHYYMTLLLRGGAAAVVVALDWAERLSALGYHTRATELRAEASQAAIWAGELTAALVRVDSMLEEPLGPLSRNRLACHRGLALALLGHIDEAERTFAEVEPNSTDYFDSRGSVLWCWAEACLWAGQPARAFEMASRSLSFRAFGDSEFIQPALARAWAEVELGREPTRPPEVLSFRFLDGAAPEFRGLQALARADHDAAVAAFDEATTLWAGFHVPRELICQWAAGDAVQRSGRIEEAVARLRAVEAAAGAIGFEPLVARVRRSLRLAGERPGRSSAAGRTGGLLTGREREVLGLVERGMTNAEIARRMSLGRPTVARMLSNAMVKLGAESRAQAVVLAARVG
jgi:DNA-binding CsgD family transcriptional regulator